MNKPNEDVAFLERVASTVERAQVLAPETREYLTALAGRHQSELANPHAGRPTAKSPRADHGRGASHAAMAGAYD